MKKKILIFILSITSILMCIFGLSACKEEHIHNYVETITAPTCTEQGFTTHSCSCGDNYKDTYIDAIGHKTTFEFYENTTEHWNLCVVCYASINTENHTWDNGIITLPPTITTTGIKTYTCSVCEKKKYEDIPIIPHEHNYSSVWSGDDTYHWHACDFCDEMNAKSEHLWNDGIVTLPATKTSTGLKSYTCSTCDYIKTETIPALPSINQPIYSLNLAGTEYVVTGFDGNAAEIVIPTTYNGLRVTSIYEKAFYNNTYIKKVTLPNTITSIGEFAFQGCTNLAQINIPESVLLIDTSAFEGCSALNKLTFASEINESSNPLNIGVSAFKNCINLTSVNLAQYTETIGDSAFENCYSLKSITFHNNLKHIGASAFAKCIVLTGLTLNNGLLDIGAYAFDECEAITNIILPNTVTSVGAGAFRNAKALQYVTLSTSMTAIANSTFQNCVNLREVELHEKISKIGISAFSCCTAMNTVRILGDVSNWGNNAFYRCENLTSLYINSSLTGTLYNENYIFYNAGINGNGITLTIGADGYIPDGLFEPLHAVNSPKITSIVIENGATEIKYFSNYNYLPYLTEITIPNTIEYIEKDIFNSAPNLLFNEHEGINYLGNNENPYFALIRPIAINCNSYTIHSQTECIANAAFLGCERTTTIAIPNNVKYIGDQAFKGCSNLTNIGRPIVISFNYNYEGSIIDTVSLVAGQTLSYPTVPARTGYYFTGWYTSSSCSTEYKFNSEITYDMTLYAGWTQGSYTVTNNSSSPWVESNGVLKSTNKSDSSSSIYKITASVTTTISFQYMVSSESNYDKLFIKKNDDTLVTLSGTTNSYTSYSITLNAGEYLSFTYSKDSSSSSGSDCAFIKDLQFTTTNDNQIYYTVYTSGAVVGNILDCEQIGKVAFEDCVSLTSVIIDSTVTSIGYFAFNGCNNLTNITFKDSSTWYRTTSNSDWNNKTNGTSTGVTSSSSNATYFKSTYYNYYWYKL